MKIIIEKPTASLTEGDLVVEAYSFTVKLPSGLIRMSLLGNGKLAVTGNVLVSTGSNALNLEVSE